ncbi:kinase-like domain-containing protein [Podospora australis]|uniref:Kinase-like domain-containing protein n=1 Tax=Podospora australis TaxID=1536484 RepID=A0AAN7AE50_9PEZI|nr:kinase-like domain-containing protein [Podospora australis]
MATAGFPTRPPSWLNVRDAKRIYHINDIHIWVVDQKYIVKQTPTSMDPDNLNSEAATHRWLTENTIVPVPRVHAEWRSPNNRYHFILEDRARGCSLQQAWSRLSERARWRIAEQVTAHMRSLSRFQAGSLRTVNRKALMTNWFVPSTGGRDRFRYMYRTDREILEGEFVPSLQRRRVSSQTIQRLVRTFPPTNGRFCLTHADLYMGNVMVDPERGTLTAIIDWETAGYWPEWYQTVRLTLGAVTKDDRNWKEMLLSLHKEEEVPNALRARAWMHIVERLILKSPTDSKAHRWLHMLEDYIRGVDVDLKNYVSCREYPYPRGDNRGRDQTRARSPGRARSPTRYDDNAGYGGRWQHSYYVNNRADNYYTGDIFPQNLFTGGRHSGGGR